jgi:hypothetical protein
MNTQTFIHDIPRDVVVAASAGISFDPEKRGDMHAREYASTLATDYETLSNEAKTEEKRAILEVEFARYRQGYKARTLAYLRSKGRCVSPMIAGPSRFPARRMEKRFAVCDNRLNELCDFRQRALTAIRKTLHPELRPIMAGDYDALDRLREKLAEAGTEQATMRAVNSAIRRNAKAGRDAQIAAILEASPDLGTAAAALLLQPDCLGRIGYADYELSNNNANIRRMRVRLELLSRNKAAAPTTLRGESGVLYEDCPVDNRMRLFFPGKPDVAIRDRLKSHGFRWSPSLGCWQAYRNSRSLGHAAQFIARSTQTGEQAQ